MKKFTCFLLAITGLLTVVTARAQLQITVESQACETNRSKCPGWDAFTPNDCPYFTHHYLQSHYTESVSMDNFAGGGNFSGNYSFDETCVIDPDTCVSFCAGASGNCSYSDTGLSASGSPDCDLWTIVEVSDSGSRTNLCGVDCESSGLDWACGPFGLQCGDWWDPSTWWASETTSSTITQTATESHSDYLADLDLTSNPPWWTAHKETHTVR